MPEPPPARGLLDTSVVIDLDRIDPARLPDEPAISAITLAELAAGPHATTDQDERARRQDRVQRIEFGIEPLPFDDSCARAYGRVYAATVGAGRKLRPRVLDLQIAATAIAAALPLYTGDADDFCHPDALLEVIALDG
ncbi:MAG TPA: type II toxin-antitoxin system VapC family toxin [Solirubrobacteraceae bacterium]